MTPDDSDRREMAQALRSALAGQLGEYVEFPDNAPLLAWVHPPEQGYTLNLLMMADAVMAALNAADQRCAARTKTGDRCKLNPETELGFCKVHDPRYRCVETGAYGKRCGKTAATIGGVCGDHLKMAVR